MPEIVSLIHLTGFATGIVLYAMLAVMTSRDRRRLAGEPESVPSLSPIAALLGLVWNCGAIVIYGVRDFGMGEPARWLVAIAFSALGFLPAVVVHSSVPAGARGWRRGPVLLAYALSGAAAFLFVRGGSTPSLPSPTALLVLTVGYLLLVTLVAIGMGRAQARRRTVTIVALAAFAATTLHLGHDATQADSWSTALFGHHVDPPGTGDPVPGLSFRLRRPLPAAGDFGDGAGGRRGRVASDSRDAAPAGHAAIRGTSLLATAALIALWVATALAYPAIYRVASHLVDRVILDRGDYASVRGDVAVATSRAQGEEDAAEQTCAALARALGTRREGVQWRYVTDANSPAHARVVIPSQERDRAQVLVPTAERPFVAIDIAPLPGSRRLLSDEIGLLESVAGVLGRRIDVLRVARERFARDLREREILQLAAESELMALRAQLNPHFLFNALTTLGYLMQAAPDRALGVLYRLTALLRAVLRGPTRESVPLGEELDIVADYLAIEHERFLERLTVRVDVPAALRELLVPPLLLQPVVENAVKHGVSPLKRGGEVSVSARCSAPQDDGAAMLQLTVADTGAGWREERRHAPTGTGVGLANLERRLDRIFGPRASLAISGAPDRGTTVVITIPVDASALEPEAWAGASAAPAARHAS
ncbi:MAG: histidine kinase [Gemmatimonadetes bacterium]|nr:histidine kinase [Gemmatimonadota bacterium]